MNTFELAYAITIGLLLLSVSAVVIVPMYLHYYIINALSGAMECDR